MSKFSKSRILVGGVSVSLVALQVPSYICFGGNPSSDVKTTSKYIVRTIKDDHKVVDFSQKYTVLLSLKDEEIVPVVSEWRYDDKEKVREKGEETGKEKVERGLMKLTGESYAEKYEECKYEWEVMKMLVGSYYSCLLKANINNLQKMKCVETVTAEGQQHLLKGLSWQQSLENCA